MKTLRSAALICLTAALMAGCASGRRNQPAYHAGDEKPPDFLIGPVSAVLTNLDGFSAHVVVTTTPANGAARVQSGDVLGRDGRLIFQPTMEVKGKRARNAGVLFFIWDTARESGYVLSDGLQGYAPISSDAGPASLLTVNKEGIQDQVDGHSCQRCQAVVGLTNGSRAHLTLWQAEDTAHFPVRIEEANATNHTTLDFSAIRMEYPPEQVFLPPDGFTAYSTSVAMMNELLLRESTLNKKAAEGEFEEPKDVRSGNWHDPNQ